MLSLVFIVLVLVKVVIQYAVCSFFFSKMLCMALIPIPVVSTISLLDINNKITADENVKLKNNERQHYEVLILI